MTTHHPAPATDRLPGFSAAFLLASTFLFGVGVLIERVGAEAAEHVEAGEAGEAGEVLGGLLESPLLVGAGDRSRPRRASPFAAPYPARTKEDRR
jgi:hypothetical protein